MEVLEKDELRPRVSVVINTLNEEKNLAFALASVVTWASEILVVDMHSQDRTVAIAKQYGARVLQHQKTKYVDSARKFAISQASEDWVLLLDADEMIPKALSVALLEFIEADLADILLIPRTNYLLGVPLKATGWGSYEDRQLRLFKKTMVLLSDRIHGYIHPSSDARVASMPHLNEAAIQHFNYTDITHFIDKMNRYTTMEAQQASERFEKISMPKAISWTIAKFIQRYIMKRGYRDGWRGFYLSGLMAFYKWIEYAKLQELNHSVSAESASAEYRRVAEGILESYSIKGDR